jgi:sulfur-oxidizing protein SoxX
MLWLGLIPAVLIIAPPAWAESVAQGRALVADRAVTACLLCHAAPLPAPHLHGDIGPTLLGVGSRLTAAELRARIVDPRDANPDTVMPAYGVTTGLNRVGSSWAGKPILTPAQIDDIVAYLVTLRAP